MNKDNFKITRDEAETVIVADTQGVVVYTTNPSHWKALKRRAAKLGGKVEDVFTIGRREVAGTVLLPLIHSLSHALASVLPPGLSLSRLQT